jgi:CheY-like chemotaxis protein
MDSLGGHLAEVKRLQPLRVLLAGRDRRYIRVTSFLLEQRGYAVRSSTIGAAAEAARRHRSDVVLLEGDKLRSEAARNAAAIEALNPHARVIVIVDKQPTEWPGLDTLPKWVELDAVVDTLETGTNGLPHPDPDPAA